VAEELDGAAAARTARFAGDMDRLPVPRKLEIRVLAELRRQIRPRRLVAPLVTLAAATVLAWIGVSQFTATSPEPPDHHYSFLVERPGSVDELHPLARSLAEAMGGTARRNG